jgi:hypothetical protein
MIESNQLEAAQNLFKECLPIRALQLSAAEATRQDQLKDAAKGRVREEDGKPEARNMVASMLRANEMMDSARLGLDNDVKDALKLGWRDKTDLPEN